MTAPHPLLTILRRCVVLVLLVAAMNAPAAEDTPKEPPIASIGSGGGFDGGSTDFTIDQSGIGKHTCARSLRDHFPTGPLTIDAAELARLQESIDATDFTKIAIPAQMPVCDGIRSRISVRKTDGSTFSFGWEQGAAVPPTLSAISAQVMVCFQKSVDAERARAGQRR